MVLHIWIHYNKSEARHPQRCCYKYWFQKYSRELRSNQAPDLLTPKIFCKPVPWKLETCLREPEVRTCQSLKECNRNWSCRKLRLYRIIFQCHLGRLTRSLTLQYYNQGRRVINRYPIVVIGLPTRGSHCPCSSFEGGVGKGSAWELGCVKG